jgi:hypothetical protein
VLERPKRFSQVMEFAQCRVESVRIRGICGCLRCVSLLAAAEVHGQRNRDHEEESQSGNNEIHD